MYYKIPVWLTLKKLEERHYNLFRNGFTKKFVRELFEANLLRGKYNWNAKEAEIFGTHNS